jgi:hypothetical protein
MSEIHHTDVQHYHREPGGLPPLPAGLGRLRLMSGAVGLLCLGLCILAWFIDTAHFYRSWLFAYIFWVGLTLGCLGMVMVSEMTGGEWGVIMRRFGENAFNNIWVMALCVVPLFFSYSYLFPWGHPDDFSGKLHDVLVHRQPWFAPFGFTVRQIVYFLIWAGFAFVMDRGSHYLDDHEDPATRRKLRMVSAAGVVIYFITMTSFAMDWILSRETNWYSSIIGFLIVIGQAASGMAFMTLMVCYFSEKRPIVEVLVPQHLNDYGNLLLTLVILWAYLGFAQLLVIWSGNTAEDIGYYTHRGLGVVPNPWRWVALFLIVGHFFIPFFCLLMKDLKRKAGALAAIAVWLLIMRIVDALWLVAPSGPHRTDELSGVYWTDVVAWLGIGGIWLFVYLWRLGTIPLLPENATDQPEVLEDGTVQPGHA